MQWENEVQHVFLVGAKSLGAYGGYETFVYKLTEYHQNKKNIKYHVACKANGDGCMDETKVDGVTRINDHEFEFHNPFGCSNLRSVQPTLRHLIDFITVQHQVGCESAMLVKKDVLILNGQKLVQGMQVHKQLMLKIMSEGIAAHHLLCLFVQLAIDKNQRLIKIERK